MTTSMSGLAAVVECGCRVVQKARTYVKMDGEYTYVCYVHYHCFLCLAEAYLTYLSEADSAPFGPSELLDSTHFS